MPDIFILVKNWWKRILIMVIICVAVAALIVSLKPKKYLSVATAVPASSYATDKSAIFNENIQALYSSLGEPDDLDRVLGMSRLDTLYIDIATDLNAAEHYELKEEGEIRIPRAALELKKNVKVSKSEYGELKVKAYDSDKQFASTLANLMMEKLQRMHTHLNSISNQQVLEGLKKAKAKGDTDSVASIKNPELDKLISEYQLMVDTKPAGLIITESARPALYPDRPRKKLILAGTFMLSLIFSLMVAYVFELSKSKKA